jgi:hypothetical protein
MVEARVVVLDHVGGARKSGDAGERQDNDRAGCAERDVEGNRGRARERGFHIHGAARPQRQRAPVESNGQEVLHTTAAATIRIRDRRGLSSLGDGMQRRRLSASTVDRNYNFAHFPRAFMRLAAGS